MIPRELLFGNPERAMPRLAPDGARFAFLAPSNAGVMNVWLSEGSTPARQVSHDPKRGVRQFFWGESGREIFYLQDSDGDENFHLFVVDLQSDQVRDLTPFPGVKVQNLISDRHHPGQLLVGLNRRDPRLFDIYRLQISSGELTLEGENRGDITAWYADAQFQVRAALVNHPESGGTALLTRSDRHAEWRCIVEWPFGDEGGLEEFSADGRSLLIASTLGSDTARLLRIDVDSGAVLETIAQDPRSDIAHVTVHPESRTVQRVAFEYQRLEWRYFDAAMQADSEWVATLDRGEPHLVSRDHSDRHWIVAFLRDDGPTVWWRVDRDSRQASRLFEDRPRLAAEALAPMESVLIRARDGLELVGYLTRPIVAGSGPWPMVLLVHGGPWLRDRWGFDPQSQWLANRGYAVLRVNFRGSAGFGKRFLNAGNGEWGVGAMQHDLSDAVGWAVAQGIADARRVAIMGGSYGGYATLAGLAFTPELYACGVDIVGPSNLRTLLQSIPPYWAPFKRAVEMRIGACESDEELNRRLSPAFHAHRVRAPLLIAQGANDPRVKMAESDQMVAAMRENGLPVEYVVYHDEGHGFARPQNRLDFYAKAERFLAQHLGGRSEPPNEPLESP